MTSARYHPLRDYAVIGDCHGSALISRQGSVDWCCLGRFDADPVFCRLLDADQGGFFSLVPEGDHQATRRYLDRTNILQTTFTAPSGATTITDFMPLGRTAEASLHDYVSLRAPGWLVRIVECVRGTATFRLRYRPSVAFARKPARLELVDRGVATAEGPFLQADVPLFLENGLAEGTFDLAAGDRRHFIVSPGPLSDPIAAETVNALLRVCRAFWEEWIDYCRYDGPYSEAVRRSALVLKLLTYAPTGAIVAAPTTSLPEGLGGERNWDYRYCWPRDVAFTLYALSSLGYSGEARRFADFLYGACRRTHPRVQILYGIEAETDLAEQTLDHLEGYCASRPVRVGNQACDQRQHDVYGEVLDWAYLYRRLGGRFGREARQFLASTAELVAREWQQPDHGIWEKRGEPQHFVLGKIMSWVALDRAIRMFGDRDVLQKAREEIRRTVLRDAVHDGALVQTIGENQMDASLLLTPLVAFPAERHVLEKTVCEIEQRLGAGDYLMRYCTGDGLCGEEGAFLVCSFWLVDALLLLGQSQRARELYERLLSCANDVGLYSEQIDPETHELLGNFPQALTHLGVIQCAVNLGLNEEHGAEALRGTHADRARLHVEAVSGLRGLWAAFKKSGRIGRIRSSPDSVIEFVRLDAQATM